MIGCGYLPLEIQVSLETVHPNSFFIKHRICMVGVVNTSENPLALLPTHAGMLECLLSPGVSN